MKRLSVLLAGLAVAITVSAGVQLKNARPEAKNRKFVAPTTKMVNKTNRLKAIISEQPEGELKTYDRAGEAIVYSSWYGLYTTEQSGKCYIVYADDGQTIYMKDPLFGYAGIGAWVEGTIEGDHIFIPLGQSVYYSDYYQADVVLRWGTTYTYEDYDNYGELTTYIGIEYDDRATDVEFLIEGDVITMLGSEGDINTYEATGLTAQWADDDSWCGNIDWNTELTLRENYVPHGVIMDQPEGQVVTYQRSGEYPRGNATHPEGQQPRWCWCIVCQRVDQDSGQRQRRLGNIHPEEGWQQLADSHFQRFEQRLDRLPVRCNQRYY